MPGFGSIENQRSQSIQDLAATMAAGVEALGLSRFSLVGTSFGGTVACWIAVRRPDLVSALVLDAPAAIRPEGSEPVSGSSDEIGRRLYAHPEHISAAPTVDPALAARRLALVPRGGATSAPRNGAKQCAKRHRRDGPNTDGPSEGRNR